MELKKGLEFTSKFFEGLCVIDLINEEDNDLEVYITSEYGQTRKEHWNLQHAIWGFKDGIYKEINKYNVNIEIRQFKGKTLTTTDMDETPAYLVVESLAILIETIKKRASEYITLNPKKIKVSQKITLRDLMK